MEDRVRGKSLCYFLLLGGYVSKNLNFGLVRNYSQLLFTLYCIRQLCIRMPPFLRLPHTSPHSYSSENFNQIKRRNWTEKAPFTQNDST